MKTITIGRGDGCDILIDDYRISRRHAVLKVYTFGKMEIVDMGQNGTWVNGVKLRPGVPFPVKRSDVVNFAEASQLNWSQVESPMKYVKLAGIIAAILILLGLLIFWIFNALSDSSSDVEENNVTVVRPVDGNLTKDSVSFKSPSNSNVEKPVRETATPKKKEKPMPRTVQELFPQKTNKEKKDEKDVKKKDEKDVKKKEEKKKKDEKTPKPQDSKKSEDKSLNYEIL